MKYTLTFEMEPVDLQNITGYLHEGITDNLFKATKRLVETKGDEEDPQYKWYLEHHKYMMEIAQRLYDAINVFMDAEHQKEWDLFNQLELPFEN